ncbi:MAG: hypothetical protein ABID84_02025 [Chloroflexota bacterium]
MAYFLGLLLALASIALLARPILRREQTTSSSASSLDSLEDVQWRHQQVYDEIKTLILDYELGNIPPEEYEDRLTAYRLRAADLLRQQEQLLHELTYLEKEIEDRVLALRMSWGTVKRVTICGGCGGERDINATLCPRCDLPGEEEIAPEGDSPVEEEARG